MTSVYDSLNEGQRFACRVIADHARSTAFAIADGILPGNEWRNYVLRKIMRRAIYHGREHLGLADAFFYKVCDFVVGEMSGAYPELEAQRDFISKMVRIEEERFGNTLTTGLGKFSDIDRFIDSVRDEELLLDAPQSLTITVELPSSPPPKRSFIFSKNSKLKAVKLVYPDGTETMAEPSSIPASERKELEHRHREIRHVLDLGKQFGGFPNSAQIQQLRDAQRITELMKGFLPIRPEILQGLQAIRPFMENFHKHELFRKLAGLYDTFGVPRDLMRLKLEENGLEFDESEFAENLDAAVRDLQKQSGIGKTERKSQINPIYLDVLNRVGPTRFVGYDTTRFEGAKVLAIISGDVDLLSLNEGEEAGIILDTTPFYAEAGGQVGDVGILTGALPPRPRNAATPPNQGGEFRATVSDTYSPVAGLIIHKVTVEKGTINVGDTVIAIVDAEKRDATRRNHTATHLVHAALKEVLGSHVKQAGSVVAPSYLRFDFTHYQPMTDAEIVEVEDLVNRHILQNEPVTTNVMAIEEAMRGGATALFGEKYGADVRVLSVGDGRFSKELCGGTHVRATGDIGSFKITSDEAVASGVRRIRAITGFDAFERFREDEILIDRSLDALKTQRTLLPNAIEKLQEELKRARRENEEFRLKIATGSIGEASEKGDEAREIAGVKVLGKIVEGLDGNGIRQLSDTLLSRLKSGVVVLGRAREGKVGIIVRVSDDLTDRIKAGNVIKEIVPIVGGRGGGRPDMAEGGGTEPEKLSEAIDASYGVIEKMLG